MLNLKSSSLIPIKRLATRGEQEEGQEGGEVPMASTNGRKTALCPGPCESLSLSPSPTMIKKGRRKIRLEQVRGKADNQSKAKSKEKMRRGDAKIQFQGEPRS